MVAGAGAPGRGEQPTQAPAGGAETFAAPSLGAQAENAQSRSAQDAARHQQRVEELCAASIRAYSGDADLHFRARRLHRGQRLVPIHAPHLQPSLERDDFASFRGAADALALRLKHSDAALHAGLLPTEPVQRWVFELLEQWRVEAQVPPDMPGLARNLWHRFESWSLSCFHSGLTDTVKGLLLYTLAQVTRSRVTGQPVVEATEDLMESPRARLAARWGHALAGLRRERNNQAAYAQHALALAQTMAELLAQAEADLATGDDEARDDREALDVAFNLLLDFEGDLDGGVASAQSRDSRVLQDQPQGYHAFTTAYDTEVRAASLMRSAVLAEHRERLDQRLAEQGLHVHKLSRLLKALLAVPATDGWDDGQEEGRIDGRRLAQLISSPAERRLFRVEHPEPRTETCVSFLIDCSGSMKQHSEAVAVLVDTFVRALEMAGAECEVLGFTTGAWHGGRAVRDWKRAGSPAHPGRLNEVQHLIFKDALTPWRRAKRDIAALLRAEIYHEGIDGEAVDWACERLLARPTPRRGLVVVSDGCPMDGATSIANDEHYLDHHLRQVVARREQQGQVQIFGVGVGLDLSPYYSQCIALNLREAWGNAQLFEMVALLAGRHRR
jgi:cobaltochelatase CobT